MLLPRFFLLCLIFNLGSTMFCNYYPMDAKACISKTDGIMCEFSQFENACLQTSITSYGCEPTLNKLACLNQLTNPDDSEATCLFTSKCQLAKKQHFKNLGCSIKYSKYGCMNVQKKDCIWNKGCYEYENEIPLGDECSKIFGESVTPSLCQKIQNISCMSNGFEGDYQCVSVIEQQQSQILCNQLGLNQQGCIQITTKDQACIFENNQCKNVLSTYPQKCNLMLNRLGCLQIINPKLKCQWKNNTCMDFIDKKQTCEQLTEVNAIVCSGFNGICLYDSINKKCINPTSNQLEKIKCNTFGLTKQACLQIKNQYCTFFKGICEELSISDLKLFQCKMELNEDACINIQTQFQYCKWDGIQCTRIQLNQDVNCPLDSLNSESKVNGNVCQSISKPGVTCKYNANTHLCVRSTEKDYCNSPYLNLQGCVSITSAGYACQWTKDGCVNIKIVANKTQCETLGFANAISCSQVYENNSLGCYYDPSYQQCKSIILKEEEIFLNSINCSDTKYGYNKSICASITTPGQVCRWYQNSCQQIRSKEQIAQIQCIQLQFVNKYACGFVEYGKEPCRYLDLQKGCVNSIVNNMNCATPGLNSFACAIASGSCYFDTNTNSCQYVSNPYQQQSQITAAAKAELLNTMTCDASSPTIDICAQIVTPGQICNWSFRTNRCQNLFIPFNSLCNNYLGTNVVVNANTCAAIENEFPDYDPIEGAKVDINRANCKFNSKTSNCETNKDGCSTPCCTEPDKIGINAHSCSKYSSKDVNTYCFFNNDLRCQQLTIEQVGVVNQDTARIYFNANQFKCSQMSINSCYMITWSTKQRCYYNGSSCININYANYLDFSIFIVAPKIMNEYACLGIEASKTPTNNLKYFTYDSTTFTCTSIEAPVDKESCEQVIGNRNLCLATQITLGNGYCKWDSTNLKCVTITQDEFLQINTCNYGQNKKACISHANLGCQFSITKDRCIDAQTDVECTDFDSTGLVSSTVCLKIIKDKQMCKFDESYKCVVHSDDAVGCNINGGNAITCYYKTTSAECRWDPESLQCYENKTNIALLGCNDNLNKKLCLQVTTEPCVWDMSKYKCNRLQAIDSTSFKKIESGSEYNKQTCMTLIGDSYYYNVVTDDDNNKTHKCSILTSQMSTCNQYYANKQACLLQTRGIYCYYDTSETDLSKRCKPFTAEQTSCTTSTQINISVCMDIPKQCQFNTTNLQCLSTTIQETDLCSDLKKKSGSYYNKLSCSSISTMISESDGKSQCQDNKENQQTCNYEKYCYWNSSTYTCDIKILHAISFQVDKDCKEEEKTDSEGNTVTEEVCKDVPKCNNDSNSDALYVQECSYRYSKALCLEMNDAQCYFDLNQGGCNPIASNERKLSSCDNVYNVVQNNCLVSQSKYALCKVEISSDKYPTKCDTLERSVIKCTTNSVLLSSYKCADIPSFSISKGACANATDSCRYEAGKCVSTITKDSTCTPSCDSSFSKKLCSYCGCDFDTLGVCQNSPLQLFPQLTKINLTLTSENDEIEIKTNKYFLCYEVNLLNSGKSEEVCGRVSQSCIYTNMCVDATGYSCSQLLDRTVTEKACVRCKGDLMNYDSITQRCKSLKNTTVSSCDKLNQIACLQSTTVSCRWLDYTCESFTTANNSDCSIYNNFSCSTVNNCWVNPTTKLCTTYIETLGKCNELPNENICRISNLQACVWDSTTKQCKDAIMDSDYTCAKSNKFGCLNNKVYSCGWLDSDQCEQITLDPANFVSCSDFLGNDENLPVYLYFNAQICSQLVIETEDAIKSCFRDQNYQCREPIITDTFICTTPGLNKQSCINIINDNCKYENNQCQLQTNLEIGCLDNLSIGACLNQKDTCKFTEGKCSEFTITQIDDFLNEDVNYPYSISVCSKLDNSNEAYQESFIYNTVLQSCIQITNRDPYINDCTLLGINKFACLTKTNTFCSYINNKCQSQTKSSLQQILTCSDTLNWYSCSMIITDKGKLCKFKNNRCQDIDDIVDTCQTLQDEGAIVNSNVCSSRTDLPCRLNVQTNQCNVIEADQIFVCNQQGLNLIGCLYQTEGSLCIFQDGLCQNSYGNNNCKDKVNKDKCLSIRTKKQYCYFDDTLGCQDIIINSDLSICGQFNKQTNPLVCALATSEASTPCYYNDQVKMCQEFTSEIITEWTNRISFNSQACQLYKDDNKLTYWKDECLEIPTQQLSYLDCDSQSNLLGCVSITNPNAQCMFNKVKNLCEKVTDFTQPCISYVNINSSIICERVTDTDCYFSNSDQACVILKPEDEIDCSVQTNGYNQIACQKNTNCVFSDHCYLKEEGEFSLCSDANTDKISCQAVKYESCQYKDNNCSKISDTSIIRCEDAVNIFGCQNITTDGVYCRFIDDLCQEINPLTLKDTTCTELTTINSFIYCEQVSVEDQLCKYDIKKKVCAFTEPIDEFSCNRGLNQLSCLNKTTKSLQCKFWNYCYGPNYQILNCDSTQVDDCCTFASNLESCLFQSQFNCLWIDNKCQKYTSTQTDCNLIENASRNICTSIQNSFCIFDTTLKICRTINPTNCDQAQTPEQCKIIKGLPCYWNSTTEQCEYKQKKLYDECQDIEIASGNMRACLDVERPGQLCQFINNQCKTFFEIQNSNNCLDNINKVSCTQQIVNECIWELKTIKIKLTSLAKEETELSIGECKIFTAFDTMNCSDQLSYLACLKITTKGVQCYWNDEQCQTIPIIKGDIITPNTYVLINSNTCALVNNGDMVRYNQDTLSCIKEINFDNLTCSPMTPGLNKQACIKNQFQKCSWDEKNHTCVFEGKRLLVEEQLQSHRLLQTQTCKRDGLGPQLCSQLSLQLPCGSGEIGCDLIDINTAICSDKGINKYACLNLKTGPCVWIQDQDGIFGCQDYIPFTSCEQVFIDVNSFVCSYVLDDACVYNKQFNKCEIPTQIYTQCEIEGINAIACSLIQGCIFKNQKCQTQDPNLNVVCNQVEQANYQVCSLAIDRCKYSDLTHGCIKSTITDNCNTLGLSALGCNVLDECKWSDSKCQCLAYIEQFPICSTILEYSKCENLNYCFFEVSESKTNKDITQYLKNTNYGTCRDKKCSDLIVNECQGTVIGDAYCYLNTQSECLPAYNCNDLIATSLDCSVYKIKNKRCKNKLTLTGCENLDCNSLNQTNCEQFINECVFVGYCKNRTCEYMGKTQCLQNDCDWNDQQEKCTIQLDCSQISTSDNCILKKQQGIQCAWIPTLNKVEECTSTGCRYLGISQGDCMGTHIGTDVCVQMNDFSCVSCEEIKDSCICLNQSQFCSYDNLNQKCKSKSCQHHNQDDCPNTHCRFNNSLKICQPLCQYNYNQLQCNQADECVWDSINKICASHLSNVIMPQINLPAPNHAYILMPIFLVILMNL
ncbi:unnamed protein product [Paramecium primaurelia]|uniref:Uncharacterized protein n=1 Tax=Paramecium primaurelia TaxID=5886 RepID=A0A8S1KX23_PARPR|nr:unnamed protein product [Paramecium primaurelia]